MEENRTAGEPLGRYLGYMPIKMEESGLFIPWINLLRLAERNHVKEEEEGEEEEREEEEGKRKEKKKTLNRRVQTAQLHMPISVEFP